jgi:hypothetical protein
MIVLLALLIALGWVMLLATQYLRTKQRFRSFPEWAGGWLVHSANIRIRVLDRGPG